MWYWPNCVLTDYERKFVSLYKDGKKPGVLRRAYPLQLANQAQPTQNIPNISTIVKLQIARRSRVFAITFSGNMDSWRLSLKNTNGTTYTNATPRTNLDPVVTSLVAGSMLNAAALGYNSIPGDPNQLPLSNAVNGGNGPLVQSYGVFFPNNPQTPVNSMRQNFPWLIEPNWVLQPNETIIFTGTDISPIYLDNEATPTPNPAFRAPQVLNIVFYTWEFPGMGK